MDDGHGCATCHSMCWIDPMPTSELCPRVWCTVTAPASGFIALCVLILATRGYLRHRQIVQSPKTCRKSRVSARTTLALVKLGATWAVLCVAEVVVVLATAHSAASARFPALVMLLFSGCVQAMLATVSISNLAWARGVKRAGINFSYSATFWSTAAIHALAAFTSVLSTVLWLASAISYVLIYLGLTCIWNLTLTFWTHALHSHYQGLVIGWVSLFLLLVAVFGNLVRFGASAMRILRRSEAGDASQYRKRTQLRFHGSVASLAVALVISALFLVALITLGSRRNDLLLAVCNSAVGLVSVVQVFVLYFVIGALILPTDPTKVQEVYPKSPTAVRAVGLAVAWNSFTGMSHSSRGEPKIQSVVQVCPEKPTSPLSC